MVRNLTKLYVLEPFLRKPREELHLADVSRELGKPHPTVRLHLNFLEKLGIFRKKKKGRLTLYSLNFDNALLVDYLIITEKNKLLIKCEDLILKELIDFMRSNFSDSKILIFGSSVDSFKKANDVDLLVVGQIDERRIEEFSKKYNLNIELINIKNFGNITKTLQKEILKKHLIINRTDEIMRWLYCQK